MADPSAKIAEYLRPLTPLQAVRAASLAVVDAQTVLHHHKQRLGRSMIYIDSVVGMRHTVDFELPARALAWVERCVEDGELVPDPAISEAWREPIVAMQDDDLELPPAVEMAWYAVYNFYRAAVGEDHRERAETLALAVHQALVARSRASRGRAPHDVAAWWTLVITHVLGR